MPKVVLIIVNIDTQACHADEGSISYEIPHSSE